MFNYFSLVTNISEIPLKLNNKNPDGLGWPNPADVRSRLLTRSRGICGLRHLGDFVIHFTSRCKSGFRSEMLLVLSLIPMSGVTRFMALSTVIWVSTNPQTRLDRV